MTRIPGRIGVLAAALALPAVLIAPSASAAPVRFSLPAPTGPYAVGSTDLHLVDRSRQDPWVPGSSRELMVTVRYPALPSGKPKAPYMAPGVAKVVAEGDAVKLGIGADQLDYRFPTNARIGAPAIGGKRPVLLYSPGGTLSRSHGTNQLEQLASEGYVVVAIDHTHEAEAVEFPGGRVEKKALPPSSIEVSKRVIETRVQDTKFVLDALRLTRVGMFGHSAGGFTAGETMVTDRRIVAGADLDGSMAHSQSQRIFGRVADEGLDRPFLLMSAGNHSAASDASWQEFQRNQRGWTGETRLPDGEHFSFTDYQTLLPQLGNAPAAFIGTVDPARSIAAQRARLSEFFGRNLRQRSSDVTSVSLSRAS
ncbi:alpha/beta hydrolase family protein [Amycolatopsis umgeniensis]|uniref:Putative dienelactone hydrolase n=1 Tax=Amycolatopsis umgeniensis TaxID=336628 RepID=A0A841BCM2_9PSEU|nr:alpha/beta hydrolase [Amycolatopsis umgeniensis]MBB5856710.1 putative dienelactone hydrolase [Amycolatopsis umgeniensis]